MEVFKKKNLINNELTYTFSNNKLEKIKREVEFDKKGRPDFSKDSPSDYSNLTDNEDEKENIEQKLKK